MTKKKAVLIGVGVLVVLLGAVWFFGVRDWWAVKTFTENDGPMTEGQYLRYVEVQDLAERADNYGSTTPEGTLALFIEALKKGDAELASKYFLVEKQKEYKEAVINWTTLGKNTNIAAMFELMKKPVFDEETGLAYFRTMVEGTGDLPIEISMIKNKYSQKWKIESM